MVIVHYVSLPEGARNDWDFHHRKNDEHVTREILGDMAIIMQLWYIIAIV